ncbi:MAG TPA: ferritin-like domain-containing protein [Acidimicrobiales bacterium]|nr:ferritin-like domain-containing protein [Acidimicrobiales bacterium]
MAVTENPASENTGIIGREDINDLEAILSVTNTDRDAVVSHVESHYDTIFTWDYEKGHRPKLNRLYEKAKTSMWNGQTDLPWEIEVDQEAVVVAGGGSGIGEGMDLTGTPFEKWTEKDFINLGVESQNWMLSQFMHGEQGALICTARIVESVPWIDAKYYASTQVMDEARHVEVFAKYLDEKLSGHYPINAHLKLLLDDIIQDSRWDMTYLGMQIMVEGLALAAFGFMHQMTEEPLLKQLLRYVMSDEARHVAFGVLSLQDYYQELTVPELRERQEFAFEAAVRMRDRFLQQEVWDRMGVPVHDAVQLVMASPERQLFQSMLFSKIVPNLKKLGLLDAGADNGKPGWLRTKFTELGVIQFEDWADTGEEYEMFQLANGEAMDSAKTASA